MKKSREIHCSEHASKASILIPPAAPRGACFVLTSAYPALVASSTQSNKPRRNRAIGSLIISTLCYATGSIISFYRGRKFVGGKLRMSATAAANDESASYVRIMLHVERWPRNNGWEPLLTPEPLPATLLEAAKCIHFRGFTVSLSENRP